MTLTPRPWKERREKIQELLRLWTGVPAIPHDMLRDCPREIDRLQEHDHAGWHGLANLYSILTDKHCEDNVALGMATSAVVSAKKEIDRRGELIRRLAEALREEIGGEHTSRGWLLDEADEVTRG